MILKKLLLLLSLSLIFVLVACSFAVERESAQPTQAEILSTANGQNAKTVSPNKLPLSIAETAQMADLPVLEPAPEWRNEIWINSDAALPLQDLRGKVVLLEFWTFG